MPLTVANYYKSETNISPAVVSMYAQLGQRHKRRMSYRVTSIWSVNGTTVGLKAPDFVQYTCMRGCVNGNV